MADAPPGFKEIDAPGGFKEVATPKPMPPAPTITAENILSGALKETFGMGDRPSAVPLTGTKETKTPLGVIVTPEGALERGASAAVMVPAMMAMPGGVLGRAALMGAEGGARGLAKGETLAGAMWDAMIDVALSVGTEGTLGLVRKLGLDKLGVKTRAFEFLKEAPQKALDHIMPRIQHVKRVLIPSIDPAKKLTWQEAIDALQDLRGQQWKQARDEIAHQMKAFDAQTVKPTAGSVFKGMAKTRKDIGLVDPPTYSRVAQRAGEWLSEPVVRAPADVLATEDVGGVPAGVLAGLAAKEQFGHLARSAMRHVMP